MDFDKPLPKAGGYVIYAMMLDYLDTFIHEYTAQHKDQYPSLRMTTDMLLNLLSDVKRTEMPSFEECETIGDALDEFEKSLLKTSSKTEEEVFNSRKVGLFVDEGDNCVAPKFVRMRHDETPDEPLGPFILSTKTDKDWLRICGINPE